MTFLWLSCQDNSKDLKLISSTDSLAPKNIPTKILITIQPKKDKSLISWPYSDINDFYLISETSVITAIDTLIDKSKYKGYFWTTSQYSIDFLDSSNTLTKFCVATKHHSSFVTIFHENFQYGYKITHRQWEQILLATTKVNKRKYHFENLKKARDFYAYCKINNIYTFTDFSDFVQWPFFEGEFTLNHSINSEYLTKEQIQNRLKMEYPNSRFRVIWTEIVKNKKVITIASDKIFYTQLVDKSKSKYKLYKPTLYVVGYKSNLDLCDSVARED